MKNKTLKPVTENLFKDFGGLGSRDFLSSLPLRFFAILVFTLACRWPAGAAETPKDAQSRIDDLEQRIQRIEGLAAELEALKAELAQEKQKSAKAQKPPAEAEASSAEGAVTLKNSPVLEREGGLALESAVGNAKLQFNGRVQADYRSFVPDQFAADTFSIRRARLGGTLTFLKDYTVRVEGEYAGSSASLTYGYLDVKWWKPAIIRLGQFKPYYGLERAMSTNFIDFQERSLADSLLGPTYDRGAMVYGTPVKGLSYSVAVVNGTGTNTDEANATVDGKDYTGRITGNIAEWVGLANSVLHLGGFYANGEQASGSPATTARTEGFGATFFNPAGFTGNSVDRERFGLETALAFGPVKAQAEYIAANYEGASARGANFDRDIVAYYASVNWLVTGESYSAAYKDGVFGRIKPNRNFTFGGKGFGAVELGLRYSRFDASDFPIVGIGAANPGTGVIIPVASLRLANQADAWTAGAKWIINPNARFLLNYIHTRFETSIILNGRNDDREDAVTVRTQFDF